MAWSSTPGQLDWSEKHWEVDGNLQQQQQFFCFGHAGQTHHENASSILARLPA
jgi:hypothetical protein